VPAFRYIVQLYRPGIYNPLNVVVIATDEDDAHREGAQLIRQNALAPYAVAEHVPPEFIGPVGSGSGVQRTPLW
jgi:hypothetical protein